MSSNNDDFFNAPALFKDAEKSFFLGEIEVYNWGPFSHKHVAEIHENGTAIIGTTGSGKTTLIDALMTLLVAAPKYNLASTGGQDLKNDRDLVSYVRGVTGAESVSGGNDHILRSGKTITGLAASYGNGTKNLTIGGLLWIDGSGQAAADLKKLWFVSEADDLNLDTLLTLLHDGGSREVKKLAKETAGLNVFSSKKEYLSKIQRYFEVGANAFPLLNRAAGLKQLNSINQIFRELVLEDHSAFNDALRVAQDFDNLAVIREELEIARRQRDSLLPVKVEEHSMKKTGNKLTKAKQLRAMIPRWFASIGVDLWQGAMDEIAIRQAELVRTLHESKQQKEILKSEGAVLKSTYMEMGGAAIDEVKRTIQNEQERLTEKLNNGKIYQNLSAELGMETEISEAQFTENKQKLEPLKQKNDQERDEIHLQQVHLQAEIKPATEREISIQDEIDNIKKRPGSNIEAKFQLFRDLLAEELDLSPEDIPFVAEMIEVADKDWRGAIERAVGSDRLRILVPEHHFKQALRWVNHRNNRLHVRLLSARESYYPQRPFHDSFIHKLSIKKHALEGALHDLLAKLDRHCVERVEELETTEHAMTIQGTMSGRKGRVDKQDQRRITEGWMTGFDNKDRLKELEKLLVEIEEQLRFSKGESAKLEVVFKKIQNTHLYINQLIPIEFSTIDAQSVKNHLDRAQRQLDALTDPSSDLAKVRESYEQIKGQIDAIEKSIEYLVGKAGGVKEELRTASENHQAACSNMGNGLDDESITIAEKNFPRAKNKDTHKLQDAERAASSSVNAKIDKLEATKAAHLQKLTKLMEVAKNVDTGALAETGSELIDVPVFLERLKALVSEDLPKRQERFEKYLNLSSGQGVTQLLTNIDNEVSHVTDRIESLNETLSRVEFKQGKYLQLEPVKVSHDSLKILEKARKHLNFAMTKDDQGESHFKALQTVIEILREAGSNTRTLASKALLDPRHRLEFYVVEVCRETHAKSGRISGSQSGSGGEKEMMASYILTASLSYALCPPSAENPRYATIVLDEAFSKSSQAAATRIIKALRAFGLHPLFVTPNKEMSLLRSHTSSAILVHKRSLTSLTWRDLDEKQQNLTNASRG